MGREVKSDSDLIPCVRQYKQLRKMKQYSVEHVSEVTGLDINTIYSIESGRRKPRVDTLDIMIRAIGGNGLTIGGW
jgi:transcriptional regulator with XRE-family HTH domain